MNWPTQHKKDLVFDIERILCQFENQPYSIARNQTFYPELVAIAARCIEFFKEPISLRGDLVRQIEALRLATTDYQVNQELVKLNSLLDLGLEYLKSYSPLPLNRWWSFRQSFKRSYLAHKNRHNRPLISIIIPTRGRYFFLQVLLESIVHRTSRLQDIEIFFSADSSDPLTIRLLKEFCLTYPQIRTHIMVGPRSQNPTEDYINGPALLALGKWVMVLNNDCEIATANWDDSLRQLDDSKPTYLITNDSVNLPGNCCFPVLSHTAVDKLEGFFPIEIQSIWADKALYNIFAQASNMLNVMLMQSCTNIHIIHRSHHNFTARSDAINQGFNALGKKLTLTAAGSEWYIDALLGRS